MLTRLLAVLLSAFALAGGAHAQGFTLKGEPKVAMLYFSTKTDGGWTQAFEEARVKLEKALGLKIQYVENVPENASAIRPAAERFIQRGANVIIGTAFGYSDTFKELAKKYPDVAFLNASGTTNDGNLQSFYGRTYESQYLCGMAAGAASKSGKLGFVAANPFGVVNWTVNAFALGAQKMNPNATVTVIYTGAWNDPVKERAAAAALIDDDADVARHGHEDLRRSRRAEGGDAFDASPTWESIGGVLAAQERASRSRIEAAALGEGNSRDRGAHEEEPGQGRQGSAAPCRRAALG